MQLNQSICSWTNIASTWFRILWYFSSVQTCCTGQIRGNYVLNFSHNKLLTMEILNRVGSFEGQYFKLVWIKSHIRKTRYFVKKLGRLHQVFMELNERVKGSYLFLPSYMFHCPFWLSPGVDPASKLTGAISVIFGSQVSTDSLLQKSIPVLHNNTAVTKQWTTKWPYIANVIFRIYKLM